MSKLYDKYQECKKKDDAKYYLFKSGLFYIFLAEDAENISKMTTLKCTKLTEGVLKCGFPSNALDKYLSIFEAIGINVVIVDEQETVVANKEYLKNERVLSYIKYIEKLDANKVTPMDAFNLLVEFKDVISHE